MNDAAAPKTGVSLAGLSSLGVGGPAAWLVNAATPEDVARAHDWCLDRAVPLLVVGGGSNLVVADGGFAGLVVRMQIRERHFTQSDGDTIVSVGAGESWDEVVAASVARGLSGIECLSGIPGSAGGTPIQNVGAYGQEVAATIQEFVDAGCTTFCLSGYTHAEAARNFSQKVMPIFRGKIADRLPAVA